MCGISKHIRLYLFPVGPGNDIWFHCYDIVHLYSKHRIHFERGVADLLQKLQQRFGVLSVIARGNLVKQIGRRGNLETGKLVGWTWSAFGDAMRRPLLIGLGRGANVADRRRSVKERGGVAISISSAGEEAKDCPIVAIAALERALA